MSPSPSPIDLEATLQILAHEETGILANTRIAQIPHTTLFTSLAPVRLPGGIRQKRPAPLAASGKGRTPELALRSLTFEAAERYSTLFDAEEPLLLGSAKELAEYPLSSLLQYSRAQYDSGFVRPIAENQEILWAPARSIADDRPVPVPAAYAYLDYIFAIEPHYHFADTNGCAAGIDIDSAFSFALLELVERDALAIWWYNQVTRPEIAFPPGDLPELDEARAALSLHGRSLYLFDLAHDLEVPVIAAISSLASGAAIYLGAAANLDIRHAARRAVEELLQFLFWDTQQNRVPPSRHKWILEGTTQAFPFLRPNNRNSASSRPNWNSVSELLCAKGFQPLCLDLTRSALGVPVVRAIVPGLRHYAKRFAPGRLYTVPVELGWLPQQTSEAAMNPYPVPL